MSEDFQVLLEKTEIKKTLVSTTLWYSKLQVTKFLLAFLQFKENNLISKLNRALFFKSFWYHSKVLFLSEINSENFRGHKMPGTLIMNCTLADYENFITILSKQIEGTSKTQN